MAPESVQGSGSVAQASPSRLRTTLALGLLVLGAGDLAAIDTIVLPRCLAARERRAPNPAGVAAISLSVQPRAELAAVAAATNPPARHSWPDSDAPSAEAVAPPPAPPTAPQPASAGETEPAPQAAFPSTWPCLLFAINSAQLSVKSQHTLDSLATILRRRNGLKVALDGHTDDSGAEELNRSLSRGRALEAQRWLLARGVRSRQVAVRGFGSARPAAAGQSPEAREQNRRVDITLSERDH